MKDQPQFGKTGVGKDSVDGANPAPSAGDLPGKWEQSHEQGENTDLPVSTNEWEFVWLQILFPLTSPAPRRRELLAKAL